MMRIPDCRTDEFYNQKYLDRMEKEFVFGFDWCIEKVREALYNIDDWAFRDVLDVRPSDVVKVINELTPWIEDRLELDRNEMITSMLDDLDDEEYEKRKQEADKTTDYSNPNK